MYIKPYTGLTVAKTALPMACGTLTTANVKPAIKSAVNCSRSNGKNELEGASCTVFNPLLHYAY